MIKKLTLLFCLLTVLAVSAMAQGPSLTLTPPSASLPQGTTQIFTASFSDGSTVKMCTWNATGVPPNSMTPVGMASAAAVFAAGTAPGQYVVTAVCSNRNGVTAVGNAPVTVTP
jgi:hypothetical protein